MDLSPPTDANDLVRTAAFRLLLERDEPIEVDDLARSIGVKPERLGGLLEELDAAGKIRRDEAGRVTGSAGLSVVPDRHEIELQGRRFWTWCAYDIFGIFGALEASGRAISPSPLGTTINLDFVSGRPAPNTAVLFRPDEELMDCCANVYEEWCPNSNLFTTAGSAVAWAKERNLSGQVLEVDEASDLATQAWADVAEKGGSHAERNRS